MSIRTYLPQLLRIIKISCRYTARYDAQIRANLTGGALTAYSAWATACLAFLAAFPAITVLADKE